VASTWSARERSGRLTVPHTPDLPLDHARALIERAIDKAEQFGLRGSVAVAGGSGVLVSASRMDASGAGGMARARSKAWIAATQQVPSAEHLRRMTTIAPPVAAGFVACSPEARFPGAGGLPIRSAGPDGLVIGGIAASGAAVSPFYPDGTDPMQMIADGRAANPEDLVVHYALGLPYAGQHGDDEQRWRAAFGEWPPGSPAGQGMAAAPAARGQPEHRWAIGLADQVIAAAEQRGVQVAVAVTDHYGDPIQQDWMAGAPTAAVGVAHAVAASAATFQCPSGELAARYPGAAGLLTAALSAAGGLASPVLPVPGGLPVLENGRVVAGLGVAGRDPGVGQEIAAAVLAGQRPAALDGQPGAAPDGRPRAAG
jgi:uncharacterized protein GlcG (DUF336 family)